MSERSSGPAAVGVIDPSIDPVENFREHISFGSGDIWAVWLPEHPLTAGEHPRPDHAVLVCITGNGPTSEANARFIAECFSAAPLAQQGAGSTGAPLDKPSHTTTEVKPWTTHNAKLTVEQFGDMLVKLTIAAHDYSTPIENGPARCTTIFRHHLLDALGVSGAGSTGAPPDTFRNTFRNPVAQALWGDKEKGK